MDDSISRQAAIDAIREMQPELLTSMTTRKKLPFNKLVEALKVFGYEAEEMRGEAND